MLAVLRLAATGRREGLAASLGCFLATLAAGTWHIMASRSSTASIGFVVLPTVAAISGVIALGYGASRRRPGAVARVLGVVAVIVAAAIPALELFAVGETTSLNERRRSEQARLDKAYAADRAELRAFLLRVPPERRGDTLTALLRARRDDRAFVLAVLGSEYGVDSLLLDTLARSPDLGLALAAVRNRGAASFTLATVYRTATYRGYFLQAIAAHSNTPPEILREIHHLQPAPIRGLSYQLARNLSTPSDVIADLVRSSKDPQVLGLLARQPRLDCSLIQTLAERATAEVRRDPILQMRLSRCAGGGPPERHERTNGGPGR
ncbi:MAG TPA: hypothetical protein VF461_14720 [Gemmatimonadaceae bacterium]